MMFRYPTIVTDRWPLGNGRGAMALFFCILIESKSQNDEGMWRHELSHIIRQWLFAFAGAWVGIAIGGVEWFPIVNGLLIGAGVWFALYKLVRQFRLREESIAYREQMRWPDGKGGALTLQLAASRLALPMYRLGLTTKEAMLILVNR